MNGLYFIAKVEKIYNRKYNPNKIRLLFYFVDI